MKSGSVKFKTKNDFCIKLRTWSILDGPVFGLEVWIWGNLNLGVGIDLGLVLNLDLITFSEPTAIS